MIISIWIEGVSILEIVAVWWRVDQISTENFIIGIFMKPIRAKIDEILSPFTGSLKDFDIIIYPK